MILRFRRVLNRLALHAMAAAALAGCDRSATAPGRRWQATSAGTPGFTAVLQSPRGEFRQEIAQGLLDQQDPRPITLSE
jgi:hypothetical protein